MDGVGESGHHKHCVIVVTSAGVTIKVHRLGARVGVTCSNVWVPTACGIVVVPCPTRVDGGGGGRRSCPAFEILSVWKRHGRAGGAETNRLPNAGVAVGTHTLHPDGVVGVGLQAVDSVESVGNIVGITLTADKALRTVFDIGFGLAAPSDVCRSVRCGYKRQIGGTRAPANRETHVGNKSGVLAGIGVGVFAVVPLNIVSSGGEGINNIRFGDGAAFSCIKTRNGHPVNGNIKGVVRGLRRHTVGETNAAVGTLRHYHSGVQRRCGAVNTPVARRSHPFVVSSRGRPTVWVHSCERNTMVGRNRVQIVLCLNRKKGV